MKTINIQILRKQFRHEWLLIAVDKIDKSTTTPLSGRLLAHSKDRDEIYRNMLRYKHNTYLTYSEDTLPKGYAVAF
jgi:hypothetical protein